MSDIARRLVIEQRKRLVASVMNFAEQEIYPSLKPAQQRAFRDKFVGAANAYHDFVLDLVKVRGEDGIQSEETARMIRELHDRLT